MYTELDPATDRIVETPNAADLRRQIVQNDALDGYLAWMAFSAAVECLAKAVWCIPLRDSNICVLRPQIDGCPDADTLRAQLVTETGTAPYVTSANAEPVACHSKAGAADLGSRYIDVVRGFGPNGILTSECGQSGFGPALQQIADRIVTVVSNICLPRDVLDERRVTVERHSAGGTFEPLYNPTD